MAARFCNVLALQVPTETLAAMAYDDYYPAFYFALKRFEDTARSGASPENAARVRVGNFDNLPAANHAGGASVLARFYALQSTLRGHIDVDSGGRVTRFDERGFTQAIFDHLDILGAMKAAMNAPVGEIKEIRGSALVPPDRPLKDDLVTDRYSAAYSKEYLDAFLDFIDWAQDKAPAYQAALAAQAAAPQIGAPR